VFHDRTYGLVTRLQLPSRSYVSSFSQDEKTQPLSGAVKSRNWIQIARAKFVGGVANLGIGSIRIALRMLPTAQPQLPPPSPSRNNCEGVAKEKWNPVSWMFDFSIILVIEGFVLAFKWDFAAWGMRII